MPQLQFSGIEEGWKGLELGVGSWKLLVQRAVPLLWLELSALGERTRKKVGKRNENFQNEGSSPHTRCCRQVQTLGRDCRQGDLEGNERHPLRSRQTLLML